MPVVREWESGGWGGMGAPASCETVPPADASHVEAVRVGGSEAGEPPKGPESFARAPSCPSAPRSWSRIGAEVSAHIVSARV